MHSHIRNSVIWILHNKSLDIFLVFIWTALTVVFILTPYLAVTALRTALGIPMVLFIPGYVLTVTLFPKNDDLEATERIAMSLGLSIAIVPLVGLLLNFTFGINLIPLLSALCLYTIALLLIAAYRRGILPEEERFFVPFHELQKILNLELYYNKNRKDKILSVILILSIISAALIIFFVMTTPKVGERFSEFYILDQFGKADNYITDLKNNSPQEILAGVINHEYSSINYSLQVSLENDVLSDTRLGLDHGETWEQNITFIPAREGNNMKLKFLLFKENNLSIPYRELYLWVNVTK